ncbi:creatininase family protein [Halocynthiibacter namhaensis]|uniref:creatininase family protein n=1 Tax=Halocynthiibacter namhaensis TaxID=1290553 RepID=UPI000578F061|nr:creatininase family protein [Halocynthiibacter namhaensis]
MRLSEMTWQEAEAHFFGQPAVILPTGSIEQHGPMGLIGTDAICAEQIAWRAADQAKAVVAPTVSYAPAPFNMGFPGTMSLSADLWQAMMLELFNGLHHQGISKVYVINGHGANLAPLRAAAADCGADIRIRSWWDFEPVNVLRRKWYGDWEGMHATPSEISITQATHRAIAPGDAAEPPEFLTPEFVKAHAGDKHGPADEHRRDFPDGRVGSHSALAQVDHGHALLNAAATSVALDFRDFVAS